MVDEIIEGKIAEWQQLSNPDLSFVICGSSILAK